MVRLIESVYCSDAAEPWPFDMALSVPLLLLLVDCCGDLDFALEDDKVDAGKAKGTTGGYVELRCCCC